MGALDPAKLFVILVVALIVLGPERLPRVARQVGAAWHELTRVREQVVGEIRDAIPDDLSKFADLPRIPRPTPGAVSGFVSGIMSASPPSASPTTVEAGTKPVQSATERLEATARELSERAIPPTVQDQLGVDFGFGENDPNMN